MRGFHVAGTIHDACRRFASEPAMRFLADDGGWRQLTYLELGERVRTAGRALADLGVGPGVTVGLYADNRPEWAVADLAVLGLRGVTVPIYATSTAPQVRYVIDDAELEVLVVGTEAQLETAQRAVAGLGRPLRLVVLDDAAGEAAPGATAWSDLLRGVDRPLTEAEVAASLAGSSPDDVATLIYTSGTTGEPKGVMLSHANFAHQLAAVRANFEVGPGDRSLCFLPLSHVYERSWSYLVFSAGVENCYVVDPREVVAAMQQVRPTVMVSVPRLYEKVHAVIHQRLEGAPALRRALFHWAIATGWQAANRRAAGRRPGPWLALRHRLADRLVLRRIRDAVGGPKKFFSAGGAPLAREIEEFFFAAGLLICEGYGLTETSPMVTYNTPAAFRFGSVGRPVPGCEVRIGDDGEVLVRGPNVMKGYHRKPEATAEAFVDGWFRTGDVGEIDDDGFLHITDRLKDLIITSGGKNVAPQAIETLLCQDPLVDQLVAIGDRRPYVTALVVPDFAALEAWASRHGLAALSQDELVRRPEVVELYRQRLEARSEPLARFERVKRFTLLATALSQERGELTPTLKIRRKAVAENYRDVIESMYAGARL